MKAARLPLIPWPWAWGAVAFAFPWSNSFMSVATGILAVSAIQHLLRPASVQRREASRLAVRTGWALILLVVWSGLSFFWGGDALACIHDVRVKLPLAAGGLAMIAMSRGQLGDAVTWDNVLKSAVFSAVCATATLVILDVLDGGLMGGRQASRFISHIRFGLWWALLLPWTAHRLSGWWICAAAMTALLSWYWLQCLSGLIVGFALLPWWGLSILRMIRDGSQRVWPARWPLGALIGLVWGGMLMLLFGFLWLLPTSLPVASELPSVSKSGEPYVHKLDRSVRENGEYVWTCIAWGELNHAWKEKSEVPIGEIQGCLIRFLASKGVPKDRSGVLSLSDAEVKAIEAGIPSSVELGAGYWQKRWNRFVFNWGDWFDGRRTPNASILSRSMYMKAGIGVLREFDLGEWIRGTGVGSITSRLDRSYDKSDSDWSDIGRKRPHNQFLTLLISLGVVGVSVWIFALLAFWPLVSARPAILLVGLSCLTEDTIETQAGVTLVVVALAWGYLMTPNRTF